MYFWGNLVLALAVSGAIIGLIISFVFQRDWFKRIGIAGGNERYHTKIFRFEKAAIRGLMLGTILGGAVVVANSILPSVLEQYDPGTIIVVDGDTIKIGGERLRLDGIDAPETSKAKCDAERLKGEEAKTFLSGIIQGGFPYINYTGRSGVYGRPLVVLYSNGKNVNELLVREGYAVTPAGNQPLFCPPIDPAT